MRDGELDALDRSTLRLWRLSNLVGWGTVGGAAAMATSILTLMIGLRVLPVRGIAGTIVVAVTVSCVAALVDGLIVGAHVYRWPGWVAVGGFVLPTAAALLVTPKDPIEILVTLVTPAIGAGVAAAVARRRFLGRPRALRAPVAR